MDMKLKLVKIVQTGIAAPSQWDAWDEEGRYYYLRYRYGKASIEGFDSPDFDDVKPGDPYPKTHYENHWTYGDNLDGYMEIEQFAEQGGLDISEAEIIPFNL